MAAKAGIWNVDKCEETQQPRWCDRQSSLGQGLGNDKVSINLIRANMQVWVM
jgi:hypothetical protein